MLNARPGAGAHRKASCSFIAIKLNTTNTTRTYDGHLRYARIPTQNNNAELHTHTHRRYAYNTGTSHGCSEAVSAGDTTRCRQTV